MRILKITLAAVMIVMVAACSDDGGDGASTEVSDEAKPYAEALSKSLTVDDGSDLILDQSQADCIAAKWVNTITPQRLKENGFEPEKLADPDSGTELSTIGLSDDEAGTMVDGFGECDVDLRERILTGLTEDESVTDEQRACFEDAVTDDVVKQFLVTGLTATEESDAADMADNGLFQAITACSDGLGG